ncbi:hypothetical protein [Kitasatospora aureofaciens]|uniref:hypothetical protein n=1 Tax=Kitasatospora aureofaciens TaxID=1894 RepID=UPI001C47A048|nr:hypothetical protein [Kitasatospora aureofaciens]MBV6700348.1 hypothetical protein [Kitasatospora aureofaciens]
MGEPEHLPPSWALFLGGPVPYPDDVDGQPNTEPPPPPLEPVTESLTLRRLRAEVRKINNRYWRL